MDIQEIAGAGVRLRASEPMRKAVYACLLQLAQKKVYQEWAGGVAQRKPFVLAPHDAKLLRPYGLATSSDELAVRINHHRGRLFLTDGVWVDPAHRVFPFCDESEQLIAIAERLGWMQQATCVIDLAGGCGHTPWSLERPLQILFDVNPRALAYAELNVVLNGLDPRRYVVSRNDICQGIPEGVGPGLEGEPLILANMPFGLAPDAGLLPHMSDGGPIGMRLQRATFAALKDFAARAGSNARARALVMGVSLGDARTQKWMLHDEAVEHFGAERVSWTLCNDWLLRIDGSRTVANPSPVGIALPAAADCALYYPDSDRRALARKAWQTMAVEQARVGHRDVAYGVVAVELG